jgi:hypothetical protein
MRQTVAKGERTPCSSRVNPVAIYFAFLTSWTGADGETSCRLMAAGDTRCLIHITQPLQRVLTSSRYNSWQWAFLPSNASTYTMNYNLTLILLSTPHCFLYIIFTNTDSTSVKYVRYNPKEFLRDVAMFVILVQTIFLTEFGGKFMNCKISDCKV